MVSQSPELIEIFFGLHLAIFLQTDLDKRVKVVLADEEFSGKLTEVTKNSLTVCKNEVNHDISVDAVGFIVMLEIKKLWWARPSVFDSLLFSLTLPLRTHRL
jgi:hypothetical protein